MINIKLSRLESSDASQISNLINNCNILDNLRDYIPYPYTLQDGKNFIDLAQQQNPPQTFGIIINDSELCGVIGLMLQKDIYRFSAEVGYWIGEIYWGKRIGTQALQTIVNYGFKELNINKIFAGVFSYNQASMRILEKCGFEKEGILKKSAFKNGQFWDEHRYSILKPE